ncbi:serine hydrolase [Nocardioides mangrovicus]|uniref:Serine hydrolase n=1 Tax=Nocardioides mangrovicus TaxID=2478913 RepID=A0A3L8P2Y8_9ACTN|nr:serine hydrolase [Nocardioides mangrovicus]RLV49675.1 serine hydrolase [Nocardioides mangrovicus]
MDLGSDTMGTAWSVLVVDATTGERLVDQHPERVLGTASVAKLLLLTEVAARLAAGTLDADQPVQRNTTPPVADSGLWHLMRLDTLPLADVCLLVAAVSDNWATNALLEVVGLDAVTARAESLGMVHTRLLDRVRDARTPADPPTLSVGNAAEWVEFLLQVHQGILVNRQVSEQLRAWLATSVDHSMVAAAWAQDPLVATGRVLNKTGTDDGVRADVGIVTGERPVVYAAIAGWRVDGARIVAQDRVLARLRAIALEAQRAEVSTAAPIPHIVKRPAGRDSFTVDDAADQPTQNGS